LFDEVQCGLGRTGRLFAWQHAGVTPDIMTLAKPLGGGLPMGAVVLAPAAARTVEPGDHATTFGGGPLVASAALAVLGTVSEPAFLAGVMARGQHVQDRLKALQGRVACVQEVRGLGLMQGIVLDRPAGPVVAKAMELGLLLVSAGPDVIRLVPPLNTEIDVLDEGLTLLEEALS
jgi:acetylornithine/succinyldiaminopimelate/putrescine aminotransferase